MLLSLLTRKMCFVLLQQEVCEDAALSPSLCLILDQLRSNLLYLHRKPSTRPRCQVAPDDLEYVRVSLSSPLTLAVFEIDKATSLSQHIKVGTA
jgi:hypothetical protein